MRATTALALASASSLALAGCGSGVKATPTTIAGVGVETSGPPPTPTTPTACVRRWNSPGNTSGRATARRRSQGAETVLVEKAAAGGYLADAAGRCLIFLISPPKSAVVFVETAPGRFAHAADATGRFSANADLQSSGSIRLR